MTPRPPSRTSFHTALLAIALASLLLPAGAGALPTPIADLRDVIDPTGIGAAELPSEVLDVGELAPTPPHKPCKTVKSITVIHGGVDNFVGFEATNPRPALVAMLGAFPQRGYDEGGLNKHLIDTFDNLPFDILAVVATIHVRNEGSLQYNDAIHFGYNPAKTPPLLFSQNIGLQGSGIFSWSLPQNVIDDMNDFQWLDVYAQDDTNVDYVRLDIRYCACPEVADFSVLQGTSDGFVGPEATTPRAALAALVTGPTRVYDEGGNDKTFITTVPTPNDLLTVHVAIRLRGTGSLVTTDSYGLVLTGSGFGHSGPATWGLGTTVVTFDLTSLGLVNEVEAAGGVDVYIQDDTMVDYVHVWGTYCVCREPPIKEILAGDIDQFGNLDTPADDAVPLGAFAAWLPPPTRDFDDKSADKRFGHTFVLGCGTIKEAYLEIRARPTHSLAVNDNLALQFTGGTPLFMWSESWTNLVGQPWNAAGPTTIVIPLHTIPGMIASMNANGVLDVYTQDDTDIDYLRLTMSY